MDSSPSPLEVPVAGLPANEQNTSPGEQTGGANNGVYALHTIESHHRDEPARPRRRPVESVDEHAAPVPLESHEEHANRCLELVRASCVDLASEHQAVLAGEVPPRALFLALVTVSRALTAFRRALRAQEAYADERFDGEKRGGLVAISEDGRTADAVEFGNHGPTRDVDWLVGAMAFGRSLGDRKVSWRCCTERVGGGLFLGVLGADSVPASSDADVMNVCMLRGSFGWWSDSENVAVDGEWEHNFGGYPDEGTWGEGQETVITLDFQAGVLSLLAPDGRQFSIQSEAFKEGLFVLQSGFCTDRDAEEPVMGRVQLLSCSLC